MAKNLEKKEIEEVLAAQAEELKRLKSEILQAHSRENRLNAIIEAQKANIRILYADLTEARKDDLTGLAERSELTEVTENALRRGQEPVSMIFIDINGFKQINDTLGHDAGDSLLIQFAQFLRDQKDSLGDIGITATLSRLGGDEFAIFLPYTSIVDATNFVNSIKTNLQNVIFVTNETRVTICSAMGIGNTQNHYSTVKELLHHADKAMYHDKELMTRNGEVTKILG